MTFMLLALMTTTFCCLLQSSSVSAQAATAPEHGAYNAIYDRHNFGYMLTHKREVHIATFHARLIFHLKLPNWQITFTDLDYNCRSFRNWSVVCNQLREILDAVREARSHVQTHIQAQVRRIHQVVVDLPSETSDRVRRGVLTDLLSKVTGLATKDEIHAVTHFLEEIEKGIYETAKVWGDGTKSLVAAFKLQQDRMDNAFQILGEFRKTIRQMQQRFMQVRVIRGRGERMLQALMMRFISNNTVQLSEIEALYNGVQALMSGQISHFILPHNTLVDALNHVQTHLDETQPHMTLSRFDHAFYYRQANYRVFRKDNMLFLIIDAPVTNRGFSAPFHMYDLLKLPMATPQSHEFYSMLATDIKTIGFSRDSEYLIQIADNNVMPSASVWHVTEPAVIFLDRDKPTCARALFEGHLSDIKLYCRYNIHKAPYPRGIIRLYDNTFLLTNISNLHLHCLSQNFNDTEEIIHLTEIQSIHKFTCNCDRISADEFRIVADLDHCNDSEDISVVYNIHYPINIAYLSEYFGDNELFNLTADTLLNYSLAVQLPNLAVADKFLDERFAHEKKAAYDMEGIINSTKQSSVVFENLAHYIFNRLVEAHDSEGDFDLLSPWTWISIIMWITSGFALVMVILLRFKLRSLTLLMMARTAQAASIGSVDELPEVLTLKTTTPIPQSTVDIIAEWTHHVSHVPNLIPVEVLILLCLIGLFLFKVARIIYSARREQLARTRLILEIGDSKNNVLLPIADLIHMPQYYRFVITKADVEFHLTEHTFSAELAWNSGIMFSNSTLEVPIYLPDRLRVPFWKVKRLKSLLQSSYYATIQIIHGGAAESMELLVLRTYISDEQRRVIGLAN